MVEVSTITATLGAAITALKEIGKVAERTRDKELNRLVLELQQSLINANTQLLELSAENQSLSGRIAELERQGEIEKELSHDVAVYWRVHDGKKEGPYCQNCWDPHRKLIRLTPSGATGAYHCGVCGGKGFHTADFRFPQPTFFSGPKRETEF